MKARVLILETHLLDRLRTDEPHRLTRVYGPLLVGTGIVAGCFIGALTVAPVLLVVLAFGVGAGYVARELVSRRRRERLRQDRLLH